MYRPEESRSPRGSHSSAGHRVAGRRGQLLTGPWQRGSSRLKLVIFLTIVAAVIYVGVKVIPVLINNYQFQDAIESTARFASVNRQSPDDIRAAVLKEAQSDDIPITAEGIHVKGESGHVEIIADYSVIVDLGLYQWTLNFHPNATNNPLL